MSEDLENKAEEVVPISGMFKNWFLDYASYVILERAVPAMEDGLKPVQRRILHALNEMDDGRFNKVANVIGQTMQYHPHGDASIGDALVNIGQKELLFDIQGNWGDIRTGDAAAAPRYIEVRLSKFAKEVAFNPQTTEWQLSYDGRKKEPITLPMKFPLVVSQGADGIAVGLSTKILPHNFIEICKAAIDVLKGKKTKIYPDFPTGGFADVSEYNGGARGGKVKIRAKIEAVDKKNLSITEIPFSTTTTSLIESILKANDKGKIKIKKVTDNTAKNVDIEIELQAGVDADKTIDALYAFTDCEVSISTNACVIEGDRPVFVTVDEILRKNAEQTKELLKRELEIKLAELNEAWHFASLEKIFIEKRIYRDIEEAVTFEEVISRIDKGLKPYKKLFRREITQEDVLKLTEIKIKRISKYDSFKADDEIKKIEDALAQVLHDLEHLTDYSIAYYENLIKKYGKGKERKTEIRGFENIEVKAVAFNNTKLYVNRADGFAGSGLKKDEFVCDCSDIDDVVVFTRSGKMMVFKIEDKKFIGKEIIHIAVWKKGDDRTAYNMVYYDGASKRTFVKRFNVTSITRNTEYDLTQGTTGSKVLYFTVNPNSESEIVRVQLHPNSSARIKEFNFDFSSIGIKGRQANGNILTKFPVRKIDLKEKGTSSIGGIKIWFDAEYGRLNQDEKGKYLGEFDTGKQILVVHKDGDVELTDFELTNRYEPNDVLLVEMFKPEKVYSAVYFDGNSKNWYVKRFLVEMKTEKTKSSIISDHKDSKLAVFSSAANPIVKFNFVKGKSKEKYEIEQPLTDIIDVKGWKALGNRLTQHVVTGKITDITPEEIEPEIEQGNETDTNLNVGNTIEWEINNKAGKQGSQGDLF
ncbi:MAG: DNA topoisomerase IV [Bacteroidetes bacterium 37-13]|nr:MAG: DNA topoisomerase IV [Bacteroidetes bacterium 37-13]